MKDDEWDSVPHPICWYEGMMLAPQHFQQNHNYWEWQLQILRKSIFPHGWGISKLNIDLARLIQGEIWINKLNAIMPDGLVVNFEFDPNDAQSSPLSLPLSDIEALAQKRNETIHLVVPKRVPGCASDNTSIQRYESTEGVAEKDDNTGEGDLIIQRLSPKLSLQATSHVSSKYTSVALFEVVQPDAGNYQLSEYCPPIINMGAQPLLSTTAEDHKGITLQQRCQDLALSMRKKARQLAGYVEAGDERLGHRITKIHRDWLLVLSKSLPEFEILSDDPLTPPHTLYCALARLVGEFSELDPACIPPKLPAYQHHDILRAFSPALAYLSSQLKVVNLRFSSLHFEEGREGLFTLQYDKAWAGQDLLVELSAYDNGDSQELATWFKACRIASLKMHESLAKRRLHGAEVKQIESDEQTGIVAGSGRALFIVKADPAYILQGQQLVVRCTNGKLKSYQPKRLTLHLLNENRS